VEMTNRQVALLASSNFHTALFGVTADAEKLLNWLDEGDIADDAADEQMSQEIRDRLIELAWNV